MIETAGLFGAVQQVPDTPQRRPDRNLNRIALSNSTAGECAPMQAVKQLVTSAKSEKLFCFSTTLIAFVIAYTI